MRRAGTPRHRCRRRPRDSRLRRSPHPLRRPGLVGRRAVAQLDARGHHLRDGELRGRVRAGAARTRGSPGRSDGRGRGHPRRGAGRGHPVGLGVVRRLHGGGRRAPARHRLHGAGAARPAPHLCDGRARGGRAAGQRRRHRGHARAPAPGARGRRGRLHHRAHRQPPDGARRRHPGVGGLCPRAHVSGRRVPRPRPWRPAGGQRLRPDAGAGPLRSRVRPPRGDGGRQRPAAVDLDHGARPRARSVAPHHGPRRARRRPRRRPPLSGGRPRHRRPARARCQLPPLHGLPVLPGDRPPAARRAGDSPAHARTPLAHPVRAERAGRGRHAHPATGRPLPGQPAERGAQAVSDGGATGLRAGRRRAPRRPAARCSTSSTTRCSRTTAARFSTSPSTTTAGSISVPCARC